MSLSARLLFAGGAVVEGAVSIDGICQLSNGVGHVVGWDWAFTYRSKRYTQITHSFDGGPFKTENDAIADFKKYGEIIETQGEELE